jgi:hypothetical protein
MLTNIVRMDGNQMVACFSPKKAHLRGPGPLHHASIDNSSN